ncbi:MAG: UbiH/UbiF/VisC/COQ6 family ubiquinone biosynthesis hydroxylase [Sphingomonadales bacterium]
MPDNNTLSVDVVIAGGGLVGLTLGAGLAAQGLSVAVVDRQAAAVQLDPGFDGRASAIAYASYRMLETLGAWKEMGGEAEAIKEIRVSDGPSLLHLHFDHRELGEGPLGYMVENRHIRHGLFKWADGIRTLKLIAPDIVSGYECGEDGARLQLGSGRTITAPLVVAAEGRQSSLRSIAGIGTRIFPYGQVGIVTTIQHELPHMGVAHERFLPDGPFAILPLGGNRASLVWTTSEELAPTIMGLSKRGFDAEVQKRVGGFLGDLTTLDHRWSYPLSLMMAERYTANRLALVGDSAHGIHPIAGQGLNLGLRDVAALIEVLVSAHRDGRDLGSDKVLEKYAAWRRVDNLLLMAVTDALTRLFSNDVAAQRMARDAGLAAVNQLPPLRRFFMRHARGTVGKLPRLLRGEAL